MATIRDKLIEKMDMEDIRKMVLEGHSGTSIAKYYGVSRNMFSNCFRIKSGMKFNEFQRNITAAAVDVKYLQVIFDKYRKKAMENRLKLYPHLFITKKGPTYHERLCSQMFRRWNNSLYDWEKKGLI